MKKLLSLALICLWLINNSSGQNLVPNPGLRNISNVLNLLIQIKQTPDRSALELSQLPWGGGDFRQMNPDKGKPATVQTKFKILYDAKNLYIALRITILNLIK